MLLWVVIFFQKDSSKHSADKVLSYCRWQWPVSLVVLICRRARTHAHAHTFSRRFQ